MNKKLLKVFFLYFIFSLNNINALDISITDKAAEAYLHSEYNIGSAYTGSFSAIGNIELNDLFLFRSGFLIGKSGASLDLRLFASADISVFSAQYLRPLSFSLKWLYTGLFEYEAHAHSVIPMIEYGTDRAGISLGINFRFTSYFSEKAQFESILTFLIYFNIINNGTLRIGLNFGNYDDFHAKNMGAMAFGFDTAVRINENWQIANKIEYMQSGVDGFSANFYGFSWRGGAVFSW